MIRLIIDKINELLKKADEISRIIGSILVKSV